MAEPVRDITPVFDEGWDGYWDGLDKASNPYNPETTENYVWEQGWLRAQESEQHGWEE